MFFRERFLEVRSCVKAWCEVYSYMLDPKNLVITVIIVVRLSIYGISKALK